MNEYRYIIIELNNMKVVKWFKNEQDAKEEIYKLRKQKYIDDHPNRPEWEYDTLKIDYGFNLFKVKLVG